MKIVVDHAIFGEAFQRRHVDCAAEGFRCSESEVVEQDHQHIGGTLWRLDLEQRWCRGPANVELRDRRIGRLGKWQYRPVGRQHHARGGGLLRDDGRCRRQQASISDKGIPKATITDVRSIDVFAPIWALRARA